MQIVIVELLVRNYHIFYYLFAGLEQEEKDALHLTDATAYRYLNQVVLTANCSQALLVLMLRLDR